MNRFVKGTILLVVAAFVGECLELVINMVLARQLGEEGLGLYMAIFPTIMFLVVIASMELPISVSKVVAERESTYHRGILQHTLRFTAVMTFVFLLTAAMIFPLIPVFNQYHPLVKWLAALLIPVISFSSIARGYFMGVQDMGKIALSNLLRRLIQLVLLIAVYQLFQFEADIAILIAISTLIATELFVFVYLFFMFVLEMMRMRMQPTTPIERYSVIKALTSVSIPTTGLRIFYAASFAIKPFLIKEALIRSGMLENMAVIQYGKLAGMVFAIGFFPAFIAHSLLIVLIPKVAELYAKKDIVQLRRLLKKIMLFTGLYAVPSGYIFYFYSTQLTTIFFKAPSAAIYLQLLVPYFFFHFFIIPMQAFLIGLGLVKHAFFHSMWSTIIQFALIYILGSMPQLQMLGVIISLNIGIILLTTMHFITIRNKLGELYSWRLSEAPYGRRQLGEQP